MFNQPRLLIVTDSYLPLSLSIVSYYVKCIEQARNEGWAVELIEPSKTQGLSDPTSYIANVIDTFQPDYIHISCTGFLSDAAIRYCFRSGIRFTSTYHTDMPGFWSTSEKGNFDDFVKLVAKYYQHHECVYTHSPSAAENMSRYGIGKTQSVWWPAVVAENFEQPRVKAEKRSRPRLLSAGRVSRQKNLDVFCQLDPDKYDLFVVGDGDYKADLEKKYPHVKFLGWKKGLDLGRAYAEADCMVFTSRHDTMGTVNVEAPWAGTPTAAYPCQGPIDAIDQGINGYCNEDLEQAIQDCLKLDRKQVAEFTRNKWTWERSWSSLKNNLIKIQGEQHENYNQKDVCAQQISSMVGQPT